MEAAPPDYATSPINASLSAEDKTDLLRQMMRIRRFEMAAQKSYTQTGMIGGFLHLYNGQEAVAMGTISLAKGNKHDHVITAYRNHGHALAVGMSMDECMAELYGKATGCSQGKGGSMHFFAPDKNYWGGHGIVAGQTPLGLGLAFGTKYLGEKGCCLCYMGDGAINQGVYHESLNLASLWDIPVIYVIENNGYSMGTSQKRSSAYTDNIAKRAEGYAIDWDQINGHDIYEVRAKTQIAIDRAKNESRPTVLEIATYRYHGHSIADANTKKYRTAEEIEIYKTSYDPITVFQNRLIHEGVLTEESAKEIDKAAKAEATASVKFAEESPFPEPSSIMDHVYYETDNKTAAGTTGTHFFSPAV